MKHTMRNFLFYSTLIIYIFWPGLSSAQSPVVQFGTPYTMVGGVGFITPGSNIMCNGYHPWPPYMTSTVWFSNGINTYSATGANPTGYGGAFALYMGVAAPGTNYYFTSNTGISGFSGPFTVGSPDSQKPYWPYMNSASSVVYDRNVDIYLSCHDNVAVTGYCIKEAPSVPAKPGITDPDWRTVTATTPLSMNVLFPLSATAGYKNVYVWYKDAAGNISDNPDAGQTPFFTFHLILDTGPPTGLTLSAISPVTTRKTDVTLSATDDIGVTAYKIDEPSVYSTGWIAVTSAANFSKTHYNFPLSKNPGNKQIQAWVRDLAGNVSTITPIVVRFNDISVPAGSFNIQQPAGTLSGYFTANINLTLNANDADSDVTHYFISDDNSATPAAGDSGWKSFTTPQQSISGYSATHTLTGADGVKNVYIWYKDAADIIGAATGSPQIITLDTKAPLAGHEGSGAWVQVGPAGFSSGQATFFSLAFNGSTPYVAYKEGNSIADVRYYSGTSWVSIGTINSADWVSMCIYNAQPFVAYQNLTSLSAEVKKYYGGWYQVGSGLDVEWYTSIYSLGGSLYVSYREVNNDGKATVMKYYSGATWMPFGSKALSHCQVYNVPLDEYNGTIYCAYTNFSNNKVSCMMNVMSGWTYLGPVDFANGSEFVDLKIISGIPYVAFADKSNGYKATVMKYSGTAWSAVGDTGSNVGGAHMVNLVSVNNSPCILFSDSVNGDRLSARIFDGTSWKILGDPGFSPRGVWHHSAQTGNGDLYAAFTDCNAGNLASVMKYLDTSNDGLMINNGAKLTTVYGLKLKIFGSDWHNGIHGSGIEKYCVKCNNYTAPSVYDSTAWKSLPAAFDNNYPSTQEVDFTLSTTEPDGLKIFYLWFKDKAGNISVAAQKSIKLDTHPPVEPIAGTVAVAGPHPELQVTREVMLQLNAESGQDTTEGYYDIKVTNYFIKDNNLGTTVTPPTAGTTGWRTVTTPVTPYSEVVPYTITSSGDGTKEIRVWYKDIAGNMSDSSECETFLDTSIPHGSFTINSGAEWSNSPLVTLNLNAISATAVSGYFVSENSATPSAMDNSWRPVTPPVSSYTANVPYSLGRSSGGKTVYVWYKSTSGIVSAVSSGTIKLDCETPWPGIELPGEWKYVGQPGFSDGQTQLISFYAYEGSPYVAYGDYSAGQKTVVKKFDGSNWVNVGSPAFSSAAAHYSSLYVRKGIPYLSYLDWNTLVVPRVMKYDTSSGWTNLGTPLSGGSGMAHYAPIFFDGDIPYVMFQDCVNSGGKATVMKYVGSNWVNVGNAGFSDGIIDYSALYIYNGTPYAAFQDYAHGQNISVMKFNGNNWEYVGTPGFGITSISYLQLQQFFLSMHSEDNMPYVIYTDYLSGQKATAKKFNGTSWSGVGTAGFSPGEAWHTSIFIYKNVPYAAFSDYSNGQKASVMKFNGTNWVNIGNNLISEAEADYTTVFVHDDIIYVSYSDWKYGKKSSVMKYEIKRSPGLDINRGEQYTNSTAIKLNLAATDDYSGVAEYYAAETPIPPDASTSWNSVALSADGTAEVNFTLSTITKPVTVYVWFRDAAGNISSYSKKITNPRSMKAIESYGNSSTFNRPFLIARDSSENLIVADMPAANTSPLFKLNAGAVPRYSTGGRLITAGSAIDTLREVVSGLVIFPGDYVGLIEDAKKRFAIFNAAGAFVNGFAKSVDMIANFHGANTVSGARALIYDKYAAGVNPFAEARVMANQINTYPLDLNFAAAAIEIFTDAAYSTPAGPKVSSRATLYIRVRGAGGDSTAINSIMLKAKSSDDPKGLAVQLIETSSSSDIYTGTLALGSFTNLAAGALGAGPKNMIYLNVYSKNGILNGVMQTRPKPPSGPVYIADLGGGVSIEMVRIPAGKFVMGQTGVTNATPTHEVTISKDFYMSKYEITQGQWLKVMGALASSDKPLVSQSNTYNYGKGENYPVYWVSWDDICNSGGNDFMTQINALGLVDGTFRLPTEAEWEYACRAGTTGTYYWGEDASEATMKPYCWYGPNANSGFPWTNPHAAVQGSQIVGQKLPNAFGLYDMSGNIHEWCSDWFGAYTSAAVTDPAGPASGPGRVHRGGSWSYAAGNCRSTGRGNDGPSYRYYYGGFRLVLPAGQ